MIARPILFSSSMILALLDGRKTQTRRIIKPQPTVPPSAIEPYVADGLLGWRVPDDHIAISVPPIWCPYGAPGDVLWARETWQHAPQKFCTCPQPSEPSPCDDWSEGTGCASNRGDVIYRAQGEESASRWKPSIFMPRWASRLTLRITDVRVERLQEISEADARAEGIEFTLTRDPFASGSAACRWASAIHPARAWNSARAAYEELWESINGKGSWAKNEWVWALTFEVIQGNVDEVMRRQAA